MPELITSPSPSEPGARRRPGARLEASHTATAALRGAATALFYQRGIRAVSIDEIVDRAGLSKPTLYRNFASKDALLISCLITEAQRRDLALDRALGAADPAPAVQLDALASHFAEELTSTGYRGCLSLIVAIEFPDRDHPVRLAAEDEKRRLRERLTVMAAPLAGTGATALATQVLMLIDGAAMAIQTLGAQSAAAALCDGVAALSARHRQPIDLAPRLAAT